MWHYTSHRSPPEYYKDYWNKKWKKGDTEKTAMLGVSHSRGTQDAEKAIHRCCTEIAAWQKISLKVLAFL